MKLYSIGPKPVDSLTFLEATLFGTGLDWSLTGGEYEEEELSGWEGPLILVFLVLNA